MLISIAVGCAIVAAYLDWCDERDAYVARVRERLAALNLVDAEFEDPRD